MLGFSDGFEIKIGTHRDFKNTFRINFEIRRKKPLNSNGKRDIMLAA